MKIEKNKCNICTHLKYYRKKRKFTQKYMAAKLGLSERGYQKYEANHSLISVNMMLDLATILNVTVMELLHGPQENQSDEGTIQPSAEDDQQKNIQFFSEFVSDLKLVIDVYSKTINKEHNTLHT